MWYEWQMQTIYNNQDVKDKAKSQKFKGNEEELTPGYRFKKATARLEMAAAHESRQGKAKEKDGSVIN